MEKIKMLADISRRARAKAYAPYSSFLVGAALLCADGSIYEGCNIENASFTPTCCAERVALFRAVADGKRDFSAIAIAGGKQGEACEPCYPCGVCRQVLAEFCNEDFKIIVVSDSERSEMTLGELLPKAFKF